MTALVSAFLLGVIAPGCASSAKKKELTSEEKARQLVEIANGSLVEGDPTGALQSLVQAEKLDADLPELHHSKALAFHAKHDYVSAINEARIAVKLKPDYADANNTLGKILMDSGRYEEAIPFLLRSGNDPLNREAFKALTNLGILYYRRNQNNSSREYLGRAIESSPLNACIAYYYLGHIDLRENKFGQAVKDYDQATRKFCARFADAHLALGIAYEQNRQYDKARKKFLEVQEHYPDSKVAEQAMNHLRALP